MNAPNQENRVAGPRLVAIVGPFQSGKTSLLEGILARGGAVARQGSVREGTTVGDSSSEARSHAMSVEPNVASIDYLGDRLTFFDSPGSIEFIHDMRAALPAVDAAVVVCELDEKKVPQLQLIVRELEEHAWPGNLRELEAVLERALLLYRKGTTINASAIRAALGTSTQRPIGHS